MNIAFEKWHGIGNDFVLVEGQPIDEVQVRFICDRRRGVGADGVIFVDRVSNDAPRMVVMNADGSRPEMCGNGIRCVAGWIAAARGIDRGEILIEADAGPRVCKLERRDHEVVEVTVDMGVVRVDGELVVEIDGASHSFTQADVGNPHAVTFERYDEASIDRVGPRVATLPGFGYNVEFCRMTRELETDIAVIVWERGVGRTLACGTGACAAVAVACATKRAAYGQLLTVALPGGDLRIAIDETTKRASMRGPARRVFRGEVAF
jgi:diaminopimelate epimerase